MVIAVMFTAACSYSVQTTSGADYLSEYPESGYAGNAEFDQQLRDAASVEPLLRFPARIGLARIDRGELSPVPAAEAEAWVAATERLGPTFGEFVPVNLLVATMLSPPTERGQRSSRVDRARQAVETIRLGAARQHLDAVLIYETSGVGSSRENVFSLADWIGIGIFMLPGRSVDTTAFATALLVDVRNGYPYGTADAVVDREAMASAWAADAVRADTMDEARTAAALSLVDEVERMMAELKEELDVAALADGEAWR